MSAAAVLCGQLACQRDSLLRTLRTTVLSCVAKKKHFQLELADSVLFPEGGGQPCDSGTVAPADDAGAPSNVLSVANVGGRCVHTVDRALPEGAEVEVTVDWPRRQEHTQQHSAQHLITAKAISLFGHQTDSWSLGEHTSFLDLATESVSAEEIEALEVEVNLAISQGHAVTPRWIEREDPEMATIRCRGLPDTVTGPVRVVEFGGGIDGACRASCVLGALADGAHPQSTCAAARTSRAPPSSSASSCCGSSASKSAAASILLQAAAPLRCSGNCTRSSYGCRRPSASARTPSRPRWRGCRRRPRRRTAVRPACWRS